MVPMQEKGTKRRRVKVGREPGIYRSSAGRYEIVYRDSHGKQVWESVDGGYDDAVALRRDKLSQKDKGVKLVKPRRNVMLETFADEWLEGLPHLADPKRPRTIAAYRWGLDKLVLPKLGARKVADIDADDVSGLIVAAKKDGYSDWTILGAILTPLSGLMEEAQAQGLRSGNPVRELRKGRRPRAPQRKKTILAPEQIQKVIAKAEPRYQAMVATFLFTGMRPGELLGLRWRDIEFPDRENGREGYVKVRDQWSPKQGYTAPKTERGVRDITMMEGLAQLLRAHKAAARFSRDADPVFSSVTGRPLQPKVVRAAFNRALEAAEVEHIALRDCRNVFASMLIPTSGGDVVYVSRQIGHSKTSTTTDVYADLFDRERVAAAHRASMDERFGALLDVNAMSTSTAPGESTEGAEVTELSAFRK
jgi:integrase